MWPLPGMAPVARLGELKMKGMKVISRRTALKLGIGAAATAVVGLVHGQGRSVTPGQVEGPFYPTRDQPDKDMDLTMIAGHDKPAQGEVIVVEGRVTNEYGEPVPEALVDIWQANKFGRYAHEGDPNLAPLDPDFQGWGQVLTDADGRYSFKTIKPGAYGAMEDWTRPPHIHFKVARRGYHELTTQMYFAGEPLNDTDRLLQALPENERGRLIVVFDGGPDPDDAAHGRFDIVLRAIA